MTHRLRGLPPAARKQLSYRAMIFVTIAGGAWEAIAYALDGRLVDLFGLALCVILAAEACRVYLHWCRRPRTCDRTPGLPWIRTVAGGKQVTRRDAAIVAEAYLRMQEAGLDALVEPGRKIDPDRCRDVIAQAAGAGITYEEDEVVYVIRLILAWQRAAPSERAMALGEAKR